MEKNKIKNPIFVTQPVLPPLKEYTLYLEKIWRNKILTNNGPLHNQFEKEIAKYLGVKHISLFSNGTLALIIALQSLGIKGEVITTPFSFVATAHSLWWNDLKPVFVDIDPNTLNLDPRGIEKAITKKTTAIMPVHAYGNPCDVKNLEKIAKKHKLALIYDAAPAFGVEIDGNSILNFGDISVLSFHATKVFNTFEGGAIICRNEKIKKRVDLLKNFGIVNETTIKDAGLNAKMSEFQAAMGLLQLKYINENIKKRKKIAEIYREKLKNIAGISFLNDINNVKLNYTYFPIFIDSNKYGKTRDDLYKKMKDNNVFVKKYYYPLISHFMLYRDLASSNPSKLVNAEKVAKEVLCLPIYPDMEIKDVEAIIDILNS